MYTDTILAAINNTVITVCRAPPFCEVLRVFRDHYNIRSRCPQTVYSKDGPQLVFLMLGDAVKAVWIVSPTWVSDKYSTPFLWPWAATASFCHYQAPVCDVNSWVIMFSRVSAINLYLRYAVFKLWGFPRVELDGEPVMHLNNPEVWHLLWSSLNPCSTNNKGQLQLGIFQWDTENPQPWFYFLKWKPCE